jgi:hypothetical protein
MMTNPFTAKAKPKLRSFGGIAKKEKPNPWAKKIEDDTGAETRGFVHPGSAKRDFSREGIKYTNVRDHGGYWTIDAVNGDKIYTFHNKYSAWFVQAGRGMVEPRSPLIAADLQERYISELKAVGAQLPYAYRSDQDKREADKAKAKAAKEDESPVETPKPKKAKAKPKKSNGMKVNPWSVRAKA